jgi:AcrR family transcriptional regulator
MRVYRIAEGLSTLDTQYRAVKKKGARPYTQTRRAEQQAATRRRIVEAAVDLHGSIGPAATTFSMVADRAGVQRHTLYAHFPDERSLLLACSGLFAETNPLPDAGPWRAIEDPRERLRIGLRAIYDWYEQNADMAGCVLRDAEHHALTREISEKWMGPTMAAYQDTLGFRLNARQRALLHLALSYFTWRTLVQAGLKPGNAVTAMVQAIESAG